MGFGRPGSSPSKTLNFLSCPWPHLQSTNCCPCLAFTGKPVFALRFLPCDSSTLRRFGRKQRLTPGIPAPGYAASSGFLNLLTLYSASQPSRPYFMPKTPLGFRLRRTPSRKPAIPFRRPSLHVVFDISSVDKTPLNFEDI